MTRRTAGDDGDGPTSPAHRAGTRPGPRGPAVGGVRVGAFGLPADPRRPRGRPAGRRTTSAPFRSGDDRHFSARAARTDADAVRMPETREGRANRRSSGTGLDSFPTNRIVVCGCFRPTRWMMFRALLAIYVTAFTAAGPWACCCTASSVAGAFASDSTSRAESDDGHEHGHGHHHGHGHSAHSRHPHGHHGAARHEEPRGCCGQEGGSLPAEDGGCPCTDDAPTFVAVKETTAGVACGAFAALTSTDASATSAAVPAAVSAIRGAQVRNHASHFSSGQETLRALRAYLC